MKRGFTLIEVLVALAVIAIALVALVKSSGQQIDGSAALMARLEARWVAQNHLALARAQALWPEPGESRGQEQMNGRNFSWRKNVSTTPNPNFRKLDIDVQSGDATVNLSTLLVRPGP